jgi:hypothetical protein
MKFSMTGQKQCELLIRKAFSFASIHAFKSHIDAFKSFLIDPSVFSNVYSENNLISMAVVCIHVLTRLCVKHISRHITE